MKRIIFFYILILFNITYLFADEIKGTVIDEEGTPLASATVVIKELEKGIITDSKGRFKFTGLPKKEFTLEATFIGFELATKKLT
ncbi:MAG: carboxypeptidase-like regulatory domain-containing protein [Prevotella sp.]|jgi:iron complex outermembrane receptor protein|nr:carboxypeptidase-like regulatory domain-containing protein [Prevotella sp.]